MARFRSGFERLGELRQAQEQQAKTQVAAAMAEVCRRADQLEAVGEQLDLAREPLRCAGKPAVQAAELHAAAAYAQRLRGERGAAELSLAQASFLRERQVAKTLVAWQAATTLRTLCERRRQAWLREQANLEQREIDDLTASAWQRRTTW